MNGYGFLHIIYIYASVLLCLTSFILSFENSNTSSAYAYISEMNALSSVYHWECTAHTGGLHGELSVIVPSLPDHFSSPFTVEPGKDLSAQHSLSLSK